MKQKLQDNQIVIKPNGYPFPGRISKAYRLDNGKGLWRYNQFGHGGGIGNNCKDAPNRPAEPKPMATV